MNIMLATPCRDGNVRHEYLLSMLTQMYLHPERLANHQDVQLALYTVGSDSGLSKERGIMASKALTEGYDKIFFVDSDMEWNWADFKQILFNDKPISAGVVSMKKFMAKKNGIVAQRMNYQVTPEQRGLYEKDFGQAFEFEDIEVTNWLKEKYSSSLVPVGTTGTAFTMIDCSVLKEMATKNVAPKFKYKDPYTGKATYCWDFFQSGVIAEQEIYVGEDWGFFIQARRLGYDVLVDMDSRPIHIGTHHYRVDGRLL